MKKIIACLLMICLLLLLTACGGGKEKETAIDLEALANDLTASAAFTMDMSQYKMNEQLAAPTYGYDGADVESASYYFNNGSAEEIFLAKAKDAKAAEGLEELCKARVQNQITSLQSYIPEAVPRLESAVIARSGSYVVLVVANDGAAAQSIVDGYFK